MGAVLDPARIIEAIGERRMRLTEIARALDMPPVEFHALSDQLIAMRDARQVEVSPGGLWQLGHNGLPAGHIAPDVADPAAEDDMQDRVTPTQDDILAVMDDPRGSSVAMLAARLSTEPARLGTMLGLLSRYKRAEKRGSRWFRLDAVPEGASPRGAEEATAEESAPTPVEPCTPTYSLRALFPSDPPPAEPSPRPVVHLPPVERCMRLSAEHVIALLRAAGANVPASAAIDVDDTEGAPLLSVRWSA